MKACTGCGQCNQGKTPCPTPTACEVSEEVWTTRDEIVSWLIFAAILAVMVGIIGASLGYWGLL